MNIDTDETFEARLRGAGSRWRAAATLPAVRFEPPGEPTGICKLPGRARSRRQRFIAPLAVAAVVVIVAGAVGFAARAQHPPTGASPLRTYSYRGATPPNTLIPLAERRLAGNVTGSLLGGGQFSLDADEGQVTVLNFWASWCVPCQVEAPLYDRLYRSLKPSGVAFLGLDVKENNQDPSMSFIKDNRISYPNVYDPQARAAQQLGNVPLALGLPLTVLIDKDLKVAGVYAGPLPSTELQTLIQSLQAEG
jgi:thiol-disulfide isomerase/thioredoxin